MPSWLISLSFLFSSLIVYAKDPVVFDVKRQLSLKHGEVLPKDYYLNAGSRDGLKENMLITVVRRQTLYDAYQNQSPGELVVEVGQLRIIHVQQDISVARLEKLLSGEDVPGLDYEAVMIGDRADMGSAKMAPRKTASVTAPQTTEIQFEVLATPVAIPSPQESVDISSKAAVSSSAGSPL